MFFNFALIFFAVFTRFWGLTWGNGFFFHPDENNMASALSQLTSTNFNPHFFAYGQFPLYLGYLSLQIFHLPNNFVNSIFILRLWSAVFSLLSVFIFNRIFKNKIATLLFIFTPGLIQLAHFGTTESLLILVFLLNLYLSLKTPSLKIYLMAGLVTGIGLATKISAAIFVTPLFLSLVLNFKNQKLKIFFYSCFLFLVSCFLFLSLSPYNLIARDDFLSSMRYETQVATGALKVFYTTQFEHTLPYLFQFTHIFPYVVGLPMFILLFVSIIFLLITNYRLLITKQMLIIFLSAFVYFLYFGQLYVKWTRFMSPLFFLFPLVAGYFISRHKNIYLKIFLVIICILPGLNFMKLYFSPDIRVTTANWMAVNLPRSAVILSESGNVINLPPASVYHDFYSEPPPTNLSDYDYILVPSRRVFKNNIAPEYYRNLFSGQSGFKLLKQFSPSFDLFLNSENAEETWSVFDHPTLRIFQKINN